MERIGSLSLSSIADLEEIGRNNRLVISSTPTALRFNRNGSRSETSFSASSDSYGYQPSTISTDQDETEISRRGKNKKIKLVGADYLLFKPKRPESLYCKIMKTDNLQDLIDDLSMVFDESYSEGMAIFLQLFVDLMGYQNVVIKYTPRMNFDLLLRNLVEHTTELQSYFKCVLNGTTTFAKSFSIAVFNFLHDFMIAYNNYGRLSCMDILKDFLPFINVMANSNIRVIKLTAVIIAVKLCGTFLRMKKEMEREMEHVTTSTNKLRMFELANTMEFLLDIHAENCCLNDPELYRLRMVCCREIQDWVILYPNIFVTDNIIKLVRNLTTDENNKVRCVALATSIILLQSSKKLEQTDANYIHFLNLSKIVSKRCKDFYVDARILAIQYFTRCITRFPDGISTDTRNYISQRIYSKDIKIAKEAGKFLYGYFLQNDDAHNLFPFLLKITKLPNFQHQADLLVQTLVGIVPELSDFDVMLNFLISASEDDEEDCFIEDEIQFLEIFYHVSCMLLIEKYEIKRQEIRKNINVVENNERLISALLPNLMDLLNKYREEDEALLWILKTIMLINIQLISFNKYRKVMLSVLNELKEMIMANKNKEILTLVCKIFQKLSNDCSPFKGTALAISNSCFEMVFQNYEKSYTLLKKSADISATIIEAITNNLFLLSIMSEYNDTFDTMQWKNIYLGWESVTELEDMSIYQMQCCRWYLVWELRYILQNINNPNEAENLDQIANMFNYELHAYMESLQELIRLNKSYPKKTTAYECICNIIMDINELQNSESGDQSRALNIDNRCPDLLVDFVSKICFQKNAAPIQDKRKFLCQIFKLIFAEILPLENLSKFLKHFLAFGEQYADIFEFIFKQLREHSNIAITTVCMCTLLDSLEDFGIKRTQELSEVLQSKNIIPKKVYQMMCQMGLNYVIRNKSKVALLTILQPYVTKLALDEKRKLLTFMKSNVPKKLLQHDTMVKFQRSLKAIQTRGVWVRQIESDEASRGSPVLAVQESDSIRDSERSTSSLS